MKLRPDEAVAAFRGMADAIESLLEGVSNETAERPGTDPEDDWSIAAIVSHLLYTERVQNPRIGRMLAEEAPSIGWVPDSDGVVDPLDRSVRTFAEERRAQAALLAALDDASWQRGGVHSRSGPLTVMELVTHQIAHDLEHLGQISRRMRDLRELAD